jgi:hypothetical protein
MEGSTVMKNNDNPALLAHKRAVDAERANKARARAEQRRRATIRAMEQMLNAPRRDQEVAS